MISSPSAFVASVIALLIIATTGCSMGVGAESPPSSSTTPIATSSIVPTSTPRPRFGPPPVTAEQVTATALARIPTPTPVPTGTTTGTPGHNGPSAPGPEPGTSYPTPSPTPTRTPPDSSGTFVPVIQYDYFVPPEWTDVVGDDEIVLVDPSLKASVTLREHLVDRAAVQSVQNLVDAGGEPQPFAGWNSRSLSESLPAGEQSHEFTYAGTKHGEPYTAIVHWRLRGEVLIEVLTEAPASRWAAESRLRNDAALGAASFAPVSPDVALSSPDRVQVKLMASFGHRRSGIYVPIKGPITRTEISCREVYHDLLTTPVYIGSGTWQVFAVGDRGAQVWQIFEPSLSIVGSSENTSTC